MPPTPPQTVNAEAIVARLAARIGALVAEVEKQSLYIEMLQRRIDALDIPPAEDA